MKQIVAVGALGGSGTRAIAKVLIDAGIYLGDNQNQQHDNLIFTRLFKHPAFYRNATIETINQRLDVFREYMEQDHLSLSHAIKLITASLQNPNIDENRRFFLNVARKMRTTPISRDIWGWKEPNTQIYIEEILNHFENLKYIHIVRHGLDMAYSSNKQQLINWGYKYNLHIDENETAEEMNFKQMQYWCESTKESIRKGSAYKDRFLLVNHSQFCQQPQQEIEKIVEFVGLELTNNKINELCAIPKTPDTLGRFKSFDLGIFNREQIEFVKDLGFEI